MVAEGYHGVADLLDVGHAMEFRIYAEDPGANWAPSPGEIRGYREPGGPWIRVDTYVYQGATVPIHYDPMVAKLVVWGADRTECIQRSMRALREYRVRGVRTSIPFFRALLADPDFAAGDVDTGFLSAERMEALTTHERHDEVALVAAAISALERDHAVKRPAPGAAGRGQRWKWSLR